MSLTYEQVEELFDDLVKRLEESRRDDPISYDVTEIRDILLKIHSNTEDVEGDNKRQLDIFTNDLKKNQQIADDRRHQQARDKINYQEKRPQTPNREDKSDKENKDSIFRVMGHVKNFGRAIEAVSTLINMHNGPLSERMNQWQNLYSNGGAFNGDFVKTAANINKAGFTEDEFVKNFRESGFAGHLMGSKNFLDLSGAVRQAAKDLGDIGIPASQYNAELSKYVENLRFNQDLTGRSSEDLAKNFIDLISQSGSLASAFGMTIDEFTKARNDISKDVKFQLNTDGMSRQEAERASTLYASVSKMFTGDQFESILSFIKTGGRIQNQTFTNLQSSMGHDNLFRLVDTFEGFIKSNKTDPKLVSTMYDVLQRSVKFNDHEYGVHGAGLDALYGASLLKSGPVSEWLETSQRIKNNLPTDRDAFEKNLSTLNTGPMTDRTKTGVEIQQIGKFNESLLQKITSDVFDSLGGVTDKLLDVQKGKLQAEGEIYQNLDKVAVAVAIDSKNKLGQILDNNKNQLIELTLMADMMKKILPLLLLGSGIKAIGDVLGITKNLTKSKMPLTGSLPTAPGVKSGSILSGGNGGYHFGSGSSNVTYTTNRGGTILGGHGATTPTSSPSVKAPSGLISKIPSHLGGALRKAGLIGTALTAGFGGMDFINSEFQESAEKQVDPTHKDEIHKKHRAERNTIIADTIGDIGGGWGGFKAGTMIADKTLGRVVKNPYARAGVDLAAGLAGSYYGAKSTKWAFDKIANKVTGIEDAISDIKPNDADNRVNNRKMMSRIMSPFVNAITTGMDWAATTGAVGTATGAAVGAVGGLGIGAAPGATIGGAIGGIGGGLIGGVKGLYDGFEHQNDNGVIGNFLGNKLTDIEDWWSKDKVKADDKKSDNTDKKDDDSQSTNSNTDNGDGPNNNSIISTHHINQEKHRESVGKSITDSLDKLTDTINRNMDAQLHLLNKLNDSTITNGRIIKNNSDSL